MKDAPTMINRMNSTTINTKLLPIPAPELYMLITTFLLVSTSYEKFTLLEIDKHGDWIS